MSIRAHAHVCSTVHECSADSEEHRQPSDTDTVALSLVVWCTSSDVSVELFMSWPADVGSMWADFYQTSPGMHPEFFIGGEVADSEAEYDVGLILRSAF